MESLTQIFYDEANEMLEQMEQILLSMEERGADPEVVNALFRYAHSLKGNSAAMGFTQISKFTHGLENSLDVLRKGSRALTKPMTDLMLHGVDLLRSLLDASRTDGDVGDPECNSILEQLRPLMSGEEPPAKEAPKEASTPATAAPAAPSNSVAARYRVKFTPGSTLGEESDPLHALLDLQEYCTVLECEVEEHIPPLDSLRSDVCYVTFDMLLETGHPPALMKAVLELSAEGAGAEITEVKAGDQSESETTTVAEKPTEVAVVEQPPAQSKAKKASEAQTIRVATEKVDLLFDLTSEIVIAQSMLSNSQSRLGDDEAIVAITQMERHVRDLHERVMAIRMIPVGYVFNRFPRMVRDLASSSKKEVRLEIAGEETELDRTLLEALTDPLTHLLRNSIDHGIEMPEERVAAGKPSTGVVRLNAYQSEGRIFIEVSDDGKGINTERVRQKAIALEWIREEDNSPPETLYEFLLRPGFSTAEKVSDVSGRGVGMDVVKRNVEGLGGIVSVQSEPGKGSRFTIKVPLTLAIMDGLKLRVGDEYFILPLTSVVQSFRPETVSLCTAQGRYEMISLRGRFLPLLKLSETFQIKADSNRTEDGILIVLEQDEHQIAVLADEIIGQQQIVMKSLEANFVRVRGVSGATILGDGRVALILDVGELVRRAQSACAAEGVAA